MKIRVTCSDRDATDSSSDEDESSEGKKPSCKKRFLKEITVPIDSPTSIAAKTSVLEAANPHPTEWVGDKAIKDKKNETTSDFSDSIDKKEGGFGERKRVGVQRMKSGKWGAHIEHPTKRVKHRLGIFDTWEEAASAYDGKRLEFETLMAATNVRDVGIAKQPGVRLTKSGKWSVQIVNPNKKGTKLYLGTFRTFKEAADAYNKKKMEFDSMAGSEKKGKTSRLSVIHEGSRDGLPSSVYQAEDSRVMMVNDCEKNEVNVNGRNPEMPNVSFPIGEGINSCIVKDAKGFDQDIFISNAMNGKGIEMAKQRGVRQRKSGKWTAAIRKPGKRNALHLGTFNTFEEAAEAYNEKRREFDLMGVSNKKQRESEISVLSNKLGNRSGCKPPTLAFGAQNQVVTAVNGRESEAGNASGESQKTPNSSLSEGLFVKISVPAATNGRDNGMARHPGVRQKKSGRWAAKIKRRGRNLHLGTFNTFEEAVNAYNQKRLEFDSTVSSTLWGKTSQVSVVSKISETGSVYTSPTSVLAAETCPGMVVNVYGSEGHGPNGGNQQTPDFSYAVQRGLDLGVINSYGQLVGEYSRLDDELWFCKCENDEATTGCNAGFAWDP